MHYPQTNGTLWQWWESRPQNPRPRPDHSRPRSPLPRPRPLKSETETETDTQYMNYAFLGEPFFARLNREVSRPRPLRYETESRDLCHCPVVWKSILFELSFFAPWILCKCFTVFKCIQMLLQLNGNSKTIIYPQIHARPHLLKYAWSILHEPCFKARTN